MRKRNNSGGNRGKSKKNPNPQKPPGQQPPGGEFDDLPEQSIPSGEPKLAGRSHGYIIDDSGAPAGRPDDTPERPAQSDPDEEQDWESGRHQAM